MPRKKQTPPIQTSRAVRPTPKKVIEPTAVKKPSSKVNTKKPSIEPTPVKRKSKPRGIDVIIDALPPYTDPITEKKETKFEELLKHIEELEKVRKKRRPIVIGKKVLGMVLSIVLMPVIMFGMWFIFGLQKNLFDQLANQEVLLIMAIESGMLIIPVYYTLRWIISLIESER